MNELKLHPTVI